jgi:hypothetical protein
MSKDKTHWLQNPNKNYLGHWDLPDGEDMIVTIESAQWEEVKNPIVGSREAKRVVRFKEGVKPLICNQVNAQSILQATGVNFMEDSIGCKIQLCVGVHYDRTAKQDVDCLRIRVEMPVISKPELTPTHKKWGQAMTAVQMEGSSVESIRKHWTISDEHYKMLSA